MFFWFLNYDLEDLITTSAIGIAVMFVSTIVFHYIWLKRKEFKIPVSFHSGKYKFEPNSGFYTKMKTLILDLSNHNYWVSHIGNIFLYYIIIIYFRVIFLILYKSK